MTDIINVTDHSVDLDDGRVLAPGETATVEIDNRHNQLLVNQGSVLVVEAPVEETAPKAPRTNTREDKKS